MTTPTIPAGATTEGWESGDGHQYRIIRLAPRTIPGRDDVSIVGSAIQLPDGTISDRTTDDAPKLFIEAGELSITEAYQFAAAVVAAADDLLALNPAHPLDSVSTARICAEIVRRIRAT